MHDASLVTYYKQRSENSCENLLYVGVGCYLLSEIGITGPSLQQASRRPAIRNINCDACNFAMLS